MIWFEPSLVLVLTAMLILSFSFIVLYYTHERQRYLLVWGVAWGLYFFRSLVLVAGSKTGTISAFTVPAAEILAVSNCFLLLYSIHLYDSRRFRKEWFYLTMVIMLWIIAGSFAGADFISVYFPSSIYLFTAFSITGYLFIKGGDIITVERVITGILLILWGFHRLDFPYLWNDDRFRLIGYLTGAVLNIAISFFILIAYLQDTRRRFISEKLKAEEADRLKSSFLANMSHEIRTPLNAILGFTQLLSKPDLSQDDRNLFIKNIKSSGEKLLSLLDDVLDLSKIEAGVLKIYLADVSINKIIDEVIAAASISRPVIGKKLDLVTEKPLFDGEDIIRTDETRLFQILSNFVGNAVRFTESGTITTGYELSEPGLIRFYVRDTGIGISEDAIEKIFTPFFQEGKISTAGGTGLGLAIAKGLIESLGGQIRIDSAPDRGSEFSFTIPLVRCEESKHIKSFTTTPDAYKISNRKILLVEDEPVNRRLMERFIESTGADLVATESGMESIKLCFNDRKIDLVLMDLTLPDIDGYNAITQIKKCRPDLPVIVQSATAMPEHRDRAKNAGADDFIAKPIKREELYNSIWKQLFGREGN